MNKRMSVLPEECMMNIWTFNADHRPKYRMVMDELVRYWWLKKMLELMEIEVVLDVLEEMLDEYEDD